MKMISMLVALVLMSLTAFAVDTTWSPFRDKTMARVEALENSKTQRVIYNVATTGGNSGVTYSLGKTLPAKSVIMKAFYRIDTMFAQSGTVQNTGTIAFACEDSGNILSATSTLSGMTAGNMRMGNVSGATPEVWVSGIAAQCNLAVTVARANYTAGKLTMWIEYITQE